MRGYGQLLTGAGVVVGEEETRSKRQDKDAEDPPPRLGSEFKFRECFHNYESSDPNESF